MKIKDKNFNNKNYRIFENRQYTILFLILAVFLFGLFSTPVLADSDNTTVLVKYREKSEIIESSVEPENLEGVLWRLNQSRDIEYAEPDYTYKAALIPSDTYFSSQWHLKKIKAPEAWDVKRDSPEITIAIIDSGVQINHPDLKDNIWTNIKEIPDNGIDDDKNGFIDDIYGWDFVNNLADPSPKFSEGYTEAGVLHGTIVAGIAAASGNNAFGVTGVTWQAKIMALKTLDDRGEGNTSKVVKAIDYATKNGADIINLSFVGFNYSQSLDDAIRRAHDAGIAVIAAAGNEQHEGDGYNLDKTPMYPACHDGPAGENWVIGVAATDGIDQKAVFSSYGFRCVDISAPGNSIFSTVVYDPDKYLNQRSFNKYYDGYWSGTSMATPMISGALALIESANPILNSEQAIQIMLDNADNIERLNPEYIGQLGRGRLNLSRAVKAASEKLSEKTSFLLYSPFAGSSSTVITLSNVSGKKIKEIKEFDSGNAGLSFSSGGMIDNSKESLTVGSGIGSQPYVYLLNENLELTNKFLAYSSGFRGGVNVAMGDVNGDGIDEIITGAGPGGGPHVRIFDLKGKLMTQFFAYAGSFRGGVNVAMGDVNGDGIDEIITGAGPGGGPQVRVFDKNGHVLSQFFAYDSKFRGGVNIAIADLQKTARIQKMKIITAPAKGGGPHIRIFDFQGNVEGQFFAYNNNQRTGVSIATGDTNKDGLDEIITGAGPGGAPHVKIFNSRGILLNSFYSFPESFTQGVKVGMIIQ